jgi:hypothetical protein
MLRAFLAIATLFLLSASNSFAGISSYNSFDTSGSIVAAVEIENKGIYNIITSIQFLRKPQDKKIYGTDEYEFMISQLSIEARGVILQKILEAKTIKITDFASLKNSIEKEISGLIEKTKKKHGVALDTEVVFSIGNFYVLEPKSE